VNRRRLVFLVDLDIDPEEPATSPEQRTLAHELLDLLRKSTLPRNWHTWLRNAEGESIPAIAVSTGVAPRTIATRIRRARRDFSAAIQRERMSDLVLALRRKRSP
jgi:DNA-directed RNA polymerase specialized sigma24 family protein